MLSPESFRSSTSMAARDALCLFLKHTATRDVDMPMYAKMAFGEQSFVTFIYMKAARLTQFYKLTVRSSDTEPEIDNELLDIINYSAGLLAYRRLTRAEGSRPDASVEG